MNASKLSALQSTNVRKKMETIMRNQDQIIEAYRNADAEKRLFIFLGSPSLRNEFIEIDLSEYRKKDAATAKETPTEGRSFLRWWRNAAGYCCPIFKKA